jgi:hypothetical protein
MASRSRAQRPQRQKWILGIQVSAAAKLLDRLDRVKPTGPGRWIASCPAHNDRTPSLSVRAMDDGRVLIHCFGGCEPGAVVESIGLALRDLFDRPLSHYAAPSKSRVPASDVLELISREIDVAVILLTCLLDGKAIGESGWQRIAQAARRIGAARDHVHGY